MHFYSTKNLEGGNHTHQNKVRKHAISPLPRQQQKVQDAFAYICRKYNANEIDNNSHLDTILSMYVCLCKGVTDTQIKEAVADGANSLRAVRMQLGVASQCGRCADCACDVIKEAKTERNAAIQSTTFGGCAVVAYAAPAETI